MSMKYKIVTCGLFGDTLAQLINEEYHDFATAFYKETLTQEYLSDVNAIAGFYQFDDLDLSDIRWIHSFGAGVNDYINQPTISPSLTLTRTIGFMDKRIGEYCLAYILEDLKDLIPIYENQQVKRWQRNNLRVLYDKEVLILGTGAIGQGVASRLSPLAKKITGISNSGTPKPYFDEVSSIHNFNHPVSQQIVINTLPLTPETVNYFNKAFFKGLKDTFFINVGRGKSLVEEDLLWALEKGHVRKAVLDVFREEPLPEDSALWNNPNVIITPHQSGLTTFEDIRKSFSECVQALKKGLKNEHFVNLDKGY